MNRFPFPNKENSLACLEHDYVYNKIEKDRIPEIFEEAWKIGERAAEEFLKGFAKGEEIRMMEIFKQKGIEILETDIDYVLGKNRYFCEYISNRKIVKIYKKSISLWCKENGFSYDDGLNIILSHEYFHYLEWNSLGMTSRRYTVPILKIGKFKLGETGIPALSEIAANAFAAKCYRMCCKQD